jgi:hypothetical protein
MNDIVSQIRALKFAEPFVPFTIVTLTGEVLRVHRADHVATENRTWNRRVAVLHPDGRSSLLHEVEILRIETAP